MIESRIVAEKRAIDLIRQLSARYGPLTFQIHGNSEVGFTPQCVPDNNRFPPGDEVYLGEVEGCPCYVSPGEDNHHGRSLYILRAAKGATGASLEEAIFRVSTELLPSESAVNVRMFSYLFGYRESWG
ncbi:DUF779 domain-containing protein [Chitinophaga barathri]|uniref:DUF779 domain-containing protein n=1 Tax=Chitinophaga barathri TaxID=1647451 RepID=A0A3N4MNY4_9BACT|nr:DUF779 domain-containing protein [Chitinophaga barathri]RPD41770.1 DUF779 domain-containing protein [Chitinophaga barathri]